MMGWRGADEGRGADKRMAREVLDATARNSTHVYTAVEQRGVDFDDNRMGEASARAGQVLDAEGQGVARC